MRTGDRLLSPSAREWTICFITRPLSDGHTYVQLIREHWTGKHLLFAFKSLDQLSGCEVIESDFSIGTWYFVGTEFKELHAHGKDWPNGLLATLRDEHGRFTAVWRWMLALPVTLTPDGPRLLKTMREATEAEF